MANNSMIIAACKQCGCKNWTPFPEARLFKCVDCGRTITDEDIKATSKLIDAIPRWEYITLVTKPNDPDERLNTMGQLGWELVSATVELSSWTALFFKRPLVRL